MERFLDLLADTESADGSSPAAWSRSSTRRPSPSPSRLLLRLPVPRAELEPCIFVRATDNGMELSACFIVPVSTARSVKDALTRRVQERLGAAGIDIASETVENTVRMASAPDDGGDPVR